MRQSQSGSRAFRAVAPGAKRLRITRSGFAGETYSYGKITIVRGGDGA
jgi:hypothetical protein